MPGYEVASSRHFFLLFVNIHHIGLGELHGEDQYDLVKAVQACEKGGSDGIAVHLYQDMRSIQERDVLRLKDAVSGKFNIQLSLSHELIDIASRARPYQVTVVPEKAEDMTLGGGLDVRRNMEKLRETIELFHGQNTLISLSIDPDLETIDLSKECGSDFIEIHTGQYRSASDKPEINRQVQRIYDAAQRAVKVGIRVSAGHGLTYENIMPVLYARALEQVTIGRAIIERSISVGLSKAVEEMIDMLD